MKIRRDNVTMFSGQKVNCWLLTYWIITVFDATTPFRHGDIFRFFLVPEVLQYYVVVAKLIVAGPALDI